MLYLNGKKVPGQELNISASLQLAAEDLSGNSSSTAHAETGDKAKQLSVSLKIRFAEVADLRTLLALAEGKDASGERVIYEIQNQTAEGMGIRQVRFQNAFNVREEDSLRRWAISFELVEYRSTPEKQEERNPKNAARAVQPQTPYGTVPPAEPASSTAAATGNGAAAAPVPQASGIERTLQYLNGVLGD